MEYYNVKCRIKTVNERGFGFLLPINGRGDTFVPPFSNGKMDIFFHATEVKGINDTVDWKDLVEGQRVTVEMIAVTGKGYQAQGVDMKMVSQKNHNFG